MSQTTFADLRLAEPLLRAVADQGYTEPTPIQREAIPQVLAGGDLMAAAQTGTGKTAGFTLPLLQLLASTHANSHPPGRPRALVLTPTRELAAQVEESVATYGKYLPLTSLVIFGGVGINPQISALKKRVDILVATPGRLLDLISQRAVDLSGIEILVLDEADRMLDMGFIRDIRKVLALLPAHRQNLLFSATFSDEIKRLADTLLQSPKLIEVSPPNTTTELVEQSVHLVDRDKKRELLEHLIRERHWEQVLVFTRTKHGANRLAETLDKHGVRAAAIHGNKSQGARTRALSEFKDGSLQVLVATDIAARGLDIDQLPQVVNFELPNVPEDYVHRIGRTGRAGSPGCAVSLVCVDEIKFLADIEKLTRQSIPRFTIEGFEADLSVPPEPIPMGGNRGRQQQPRHNASPRQPRPAAGDRQDSAARESADGAARKKRRRTKKPAGEQAAGQQPEVQATASARPPRAPGKPHEGRSSQPGNRNGGKGGKPRDRDAQPRDRDAQPRDNRPQDSNRGEANGNKQSRNDRAAPGNSMESDPSVYSGQPVLLSHVLNNGGNRKPPRKPVAALLGGHGNKNRGR
ncbi:DEAD/DEAH box helicase [Microvirgula aerodenitrificans]|uniref:ATP-dependent RNA helicase RhlE n=1 Tax=Microvirgula aerodenitrificans TaxID=57480 RepID=A0A2S0P844_9NEIS|nr:DEAD/DEAH box helicase [Microvirgula aerodenitrificans]AVY93548.1 RNA helicase [Microvirgula aerodenitrificans]